MPKIKTLSSLKKRVKISAKGKMMRRKSRKRHLLSKKSSKRKRSLKIPAVTTKESYKKLKKFLPYK